MLGAGAASDLARMRALWIILSCSCSLTTAHRLGVEFKAQLLPHEHPADQVGKAPRAPANSTNAAMRTDNSSVVSANLTTTPANKTVAAHAPFNATAAEEKLSLRRLRRLAVQVIGMFDGRLSEHIDPIEYLGTISVLLMGLGGAAWCALRAPCSSRGPAPK